MQGDLFGPSFNPWMVEQGILAFIQSIPPQGQAPYLTYYIADQERNLGVVAQSIPLPPGKHSYRGGIDANTFEAEWFPMIHINVLPSGGPVMIDPDTYGQQWGVTVISTAGDDDETRAQMVAQVYATALAQLVAQNGSLGIGAMDTLITQVPDPQFLDPINSRQVCRAIFKFDTFIAQTLTRPGPGSWNFPPYNKPGVWPTIGTVDITVTVDPDSQ